MPVPARRRSALALVVSVAALAAAPAAATADTFCVAYEAGECPGGANNKASLQEALDAAAGTDGRDLIRIAATALPGTADDVPGNPVDIVGAGRGATVLEGPASSHAVTLALRDASSTVSDLTVRLGGADYTRGLDLAGRAERLTVSAPPGASIGGEGIRIIGREASVRHATVDLRLDQPAWGIAVVPTLPSAEIVIEDVVVAGFVAIESTVDGTTTLRRASLTGRIGVIARSGLVRAEDVLVNVEGDDGAGLAAAAEDVLPAFVDARHATVVGGEGSTGATALFAATANGHPARMLVRDTIVTGFDKDLARLGEAGVTADIDIDYSSYDPLKVREQGPGAIDAGPHNVNVDPLFVNPEAGRYLLRPDSPLVDRGDPAALGAGESATDANGRPRALDGDGDCVARRDIGAFEFQPGPRRPLAVADAPATARAGEAITFDAAGSCDADGDALSYRWMFDDGATAAGRSARHAFATPGRHTGAVTVTDATGRRDTATAAVTVRATAEPPPPSPPPPALPPPPPPPPPPGAAVDRIAPRIDASITRTRFAVGNAPRSRVRRGTTFRYTLSEDATVSIAIERKVRGRRRHGRCQPPSRRNAGRRRCTRYVRRGTLTRLSKAGANRVRFSGRIGHRRLRQGRYRATFVATDAGRNRSRPDRVAFRIVAAPADRAETSATLATTLDRYGHGL